jgi:V8-like Glu-specific endopeptidase
MAPYLQVPDQNQLILLVANLPLFASLEGRYQLLGRADLAHLIPLMNKTDILQGTPANAAYNVVTFLEDAPSPFGNKALGMFLRAMQTLLPQDQREWSIIDDLIVRYHLLASPVELSPAPDALAPAQTNERMVGENLLRNIAFLQHGIEVARPVVFIRVQNRYAADPPSEWTGTGFLIGPHLLLTCHHVIPNPALLATTRFVLNYQLRFDGAAEHTREYRAASPKDCTFYTDSVLDFSLVCLEGRPGKDWGWLPLHREATVRAGHRVNIIHFPGGLPKKISMQDNVVEHVTATYMEYTTATDFGSSGSPVFDDLWQVVALHQSGRIAHRGGYPYALNRGAIIQSLLDAIPTRFREQMR